MKTIIYMVRHGESPKTEGNERMRGLTEKGRSDAKKIVEILKNEDIDTFVSSPYSRAVLTIEELAQSMGKDILVLEDLKEIIFLSEDKVMIDKEVFPTVKKMFSDPGFSLPGGESIKQCEDRAIRTLKSILKEYEGHKIAIGTHGMIMTLMLGYFDNHYDFDFLLKTSKPDIYKIEFKKEELIEVKRLWTN